MYMTVVNVLNCITEFWLIKGFMSNIVSHINSLRIYKRFLVVLVKKVNHIIIRCLKIYENYCGYLWNKII